MAHQKFSSSKNANGFASRVNGKVTDTSKDPGATSKLVVNYDGSKDHSNGRHRLGQTTDYVNSLAERQMDGDFSDFD